MKTGLTLTQLAQEIERQAATKRDFIVNSAAVTMQNDGRTLSLGENSFELNNHARGQLATKLDIPLSHYKRLEEKHPDLLAHQVNALMRREPQKAMIRTLDGKARGILSDRFRPLDNYDLAEAVLPELMKRGAIVDSCEVTETKLYIKAICPWLDRVLPVPAGLEMGKGHTFFPRAVYGALTISNSEVGSGMTAVNPGILEKQCTNLATFKDAGFGRTHVGKRNQLGEESIAEYLSDQTKRMEDATVWAKIRDVVIAAMDGRITDAILAKMLAARGDAITGDPAQVVEVFSKKHGLAEEEKGGLLRHLVGAGEMTRYGLQWAVTRLSQDAEDYDRASELERLGGQVIELARSDWTVLAAAE